MLYATSHHLVSTPLKKLSPCAKNGVWLCAAPTGPHFLSLSILPACLSRVLCEAYFSKNAGDREARVPERVSRSAAQGGLGQGQGSWHQELGNFL